MRLLMNAWMVIAGLVMTLAMPAISLAQSPSRYSGGIRIDNQAALDRALSSARGGETLTLTDGRYSLNVRDRHYSSTVTLQGGRGVEFGISHISGVSNFTVRGVTFRGVSGMTDGSYIIFPERCENVTLDNVLITGPDDSGFGIFIRTPCKNFKLLNSELTNIKYGMVLWQGVDVLIKGNDFHHIRNDCIQLSGTYGVTIEDNIFRDSRPVNGDHADVVQMTGPTTDTTIRNNRASGDSQGFTSHSEKIFQTNLVIENNDIAMVNYINAIRVLNASGTIAGNRVRSHSSMRGHAVIKTGGKIKVTKNRID